MRLPATYLTRSRRAPSAAGFTLIELMLTLAIVAGLFALLMVGMRKVNKTALREDTIRVAASLRAAYNMATLAGTHHRVVFNLDEQAYRIEACPDNPKLYRTEVEDVVPDPEKLQDLAERVKEKAAQTANSGAIPDIMTAESPEKALELAAALEDVRIGTARCAPPTTPTGDADGRGAVRRVENRGIKIRQIYVSHLEDPIDEGSVSINFFPLGFAEKAVIEIRDSSDNTYFLLIHRLTGVVELKKDDFDPEDHMRRDGAGDRDDGDEDR